MRGTRFLHLLAPCPPGWKIPSERAIEYARLAIATRVFPLVEIENGRDWHVTVNPEVQPLDKYLEGQGRFRQLVADTERVSLVARAIDDRWNTLMPRPGGV